MATFNISIKHSQNNRVFSNMVIREVVNNRNNEAWTHFYTTYQMPIYLVKAAVTNFSLLNDGDITIWFRSKLISDVTYAFSIMKRVITYLQFEKLLEEKWKNKDVAKNYIAIPIFQDKGKVNLRVILYK